MSNKKIIISIDDLTNAITSDCSVEEVLNYIFKTMQKNHAIPTPDILTSVSQSSIEKELIETLVCIIVKHLRELKVSEVIKVTPLIKGEIFEIEINSSEELNGNG